jgi:hypothetical protein
MADGLTTGTHIEYTRCSGLALSLLPDLPSLPDRPDFYFGIFRPKEIWLCFRENPLRDADTDSAPR